MKPEPMKVDTIVEQGIVAGNCYPKYSTHNPIARSIFGGFLCSVDALVALVNPPAIHEVGCGEGYLISRYVAPQRRLVASDFSKQIIELAGNIAVQRNLTIDFRVKSIYSVVPESDSADLILCCEVFEHLERPQDALAAIARIANPYLIASVPREPLWRVLNVARGMYLRDLGNTPGHLQHWSKQEFINFLKPHFDILRVLTPLPWTVILARTKQW